jgi:glycosyltransferase involved in cell wall biosynthesis
MINNNKITIIVLIYNSEIFDRCISYICKQTYENIEILLISDIF